MKKGILISLIGLVLLLAGGGLLLLPKKAEERRTKQGSASIDETVSDAPKEESNEFLQPNDEVLAAFETQDETKIQMACLNQYREINPETVGIITIPGTVLCHPLMRSKSGEGFYLNHDLLGKSNPNGIPFMTRNSVLGQRGANAIIYGHNIRYGQKDVFYPLSGYEKLSYYKEHPVIEIYTDEGKCEYLVFAYYLVDTADEDAFVYWEKTGFSKTDLEAYFDEVKKRNWLNVDLPLDETDSFITLSSCSMELAHSGTNRMVVMARACRKGESYEEYVSAASMNTNPYLPKKLRME